MLKKKRSDSSPIWVGRLLQGLTGLQLLQCCAPTKELIADEAGSRIKQGSDGVKPLDALFKKLFSDPCVLFNLPPTPSAKRTRQVLLLQACGHSGCFGHLLDGLAQEPWNLKSLAVGIQSPLLWTYKVPCGGHRLDVSIQHAGVVGWFVFLQFMPLPGWGSLAWLCVRPGMRPLA